MPPFHMVTDLEPRGDQPEAIGQLIDGCHESYPFQTLLGVTGSGKTLTMARVIQSIQKARARPRAEQDPGRAAFFRVS